MWIIAWLGIIETEYEKNDNNNHLAKNILGSFLVFFLRIWGWGLIYVILIKIKRCSLVPMRILWL